MNSHGRTQKPAYHGKVDGLRVRAPAAAAAALFALLLCTGRALPDQGTSLSLATGPAPVVRVQMRSGTLIVRTAGVQTVLVSSSLPVRAKHFGPAAVQRALRSGDIPVFATSVQTRNGSITLPTEEFPITGLGDGGHDAVDIQGGNDGAAVTVTVPAGTALLWANVGRGSIAISGYGGTFFARLHNGTLRLNGVSGAGYVEVARGPIIVQNSTFDRIRARTAVGRILFEHCTARQIEVSSINGNVVYDNGTFTPGLARFESTNGNVALGLASGAQVGAHSASGHIFEGFDNGANVQGSKTDAQAIVGGGGPVVTASSTKGAVYLYNGAFKAHPRLRKQWRPVNRAIRAPARRSVPAVRGLRRARPGR